MWEGEVLTNIVVMKLVIAPLGGVRWQIKRVCCSSIDCCVVSFLSLAGSSSCLQEWGVANQW
jgi:hypothetical protein